jgi:hypothetical protein
MSTWCRCDKFAQCRRGVAGLPSYRKIPSGPDGGGEATANIVVLRSPGGRSLALAAAAHLPEDLSQKASVCQQRRRTWLFSWFFLLYLNVTQQYNTKDKKLG